MEPALLAGRFEVEGRLPLMVYADDGEDALPDGIERVSATSDDELHDAASVQWEAYEEEGPLELRAVESLRSTLTAGGLVLLARDAVTKEAAGAGLCTGPHDGATELTTVGVRRPFRRRGIAAALTRRLAAEMRRRGNNGVFLMANGPPEERIYRRAGFERIGDVLHISRAL